MAAAQGLLDRRESSLRSGLLDHNGYRRSIANEVRSYYKTAEAKISGYSGVAETASKLASYMNSQENITYQTLNDFAKESRISLKRAEGLFAYLYECGAITGGEQVWSNIKDEIREPNAFEQIQISNSRDRGPCFGPRSKRKTYIGVD